MSKQARFAGWVVHRSLPSSTRVAVSVAVNQRREKSALLQGILACTAVKKSVQPSRGCEDYLGGAVEVSHEDGVRELHSLAPSPFVKRVMTASAA